MALGIHVGASGQKTFYNAGQANTAANNNRLEPTRESDRLPKTSQMEIGLDKSFLVSILRPLLIAQSSIGDGKSHILKTVDDLAKGSQIALLGSVNQWCKLLHLDSPQTQKAF